MPTPADPRPDANLRVAARSAELSSQAAALPRRSRWRFRAWLALPLAGLLIAGAWLWQRECVRQEWRQAQAALDRHDLAAAATHLDAYLASRPDDVAAWLLAGRTARRLGRYAQAEHYLTRCQELGGITDATRLEWDLYHVQQGQLGAIHTRLRMTVGPDHPDAPLVLEALARGYLSTDRLADALEACDLWSARQPEHPWPWLWRGGIYEQLANFDQALADYQHALTLAPDDRDVHLALAALLIRGRRPVPAAEQYTFILGRWPDHPDALVGLARCRIEEGDAAAAVPLLDRVLAMTPNAALALRLRGKAALEENDAAGAEGWLVSAVQQAPDDPEALYQLIQALRAQGKHAAADRHAPRLEQLRADGARFDTLIRAIARRPDDASMRHEAGLLALRLGRSDEGVRLLQSALRAPGAGSATADHRPTHAALADHFARIGDPRAETHRRLAQSPE